MPGEKAWAVLLTEAFISFFLSTRTSTPAERRSAQKRGWRTTKGFLRRDDVQRHVLSDGVLDVVLEFLIEHFALLNGQFAFFHQLVQNPFGLFLCRGDRADAGQNQFAESFAQVIDP